MREIPERHEPIVLQAMVNLIENGYRVISPDGEDVTDELREDAIEGGAV